MIVTKQFTFLVCEDCATFTENDPSYLAAHEGHRIIGIAGDDGEEMSRVAARHIMLAQRMRSGGPFGLADLREKTAP